jgi:gamma-glutamylcyclotransferase (GGCT)/AIG2-like uncharacterized protein YtfP
MKQGDILFVYGTLRRGEKMSLENNRAVLFLSEGKINGEMYHLGGYPGVLLEPGIFDPAKPVVFGDLFMIRDQSITPVLDAYEGVPHGLYGRTQTLTECGRLVWTYFYKPSVAHLEPLRVGDWRTGKNANLEMSIKGAA